MHLVAILGHSPGPICNAVRGIVQVGMQIKQLTLLQNSGSKASISLLKAQVKSDSPDLILKVHEIPSLDEPHTTMVERFRSLELSATHILTDTSAKLLLCSLQCHLPQDVIPVHTRWDREKDILTMVVQGHAPVDFEGINHDQALAVHGLTPLPLREEKFSKRRYGEEKTLVLPMHPFSSGIGGKTIVEANEVTVDSRGSLTIQYEVPKDYPLFRSEWEKVVFGQAGRWSHILGDHAASFKATGVQPDSSLWHRLQGLQWEVSQ